MVKVYNPIYDTVFKYLMEDERIQIAILDGILNKNIIDVEIKSSEHAEHKGDQLRLSSIEFSVTIGTPNGNSETKSLILQKPIMPEFHYSPSDLIFRRLLYAAFDKKNQSNLRLEDEMEYERIIEIKELEELRNELQYANSKLVEKNNQLAAALKMLTSLGATSEQIAAQLNIPITDVETVIKSLT